MSNDHETLAGLALRHSREIADPIRRASVIELAASFLRDEDQRAQCGAIAASIREADRAQLLLPSIAEPLVH